MRVSEGAFSMKMSDLGPQHFHKIDDALQLRRWERIPKEPKAYKLSPRVLEEHCKVYFNQAKTIRHERAEELGVSSEALMKMRLGWARQNQLLALRTRCVHEGYWTLPLYDANENICGIALQPPHGSEAHDERDQIKKMVSGSKPGVYQARHPKLAPEILLVCEGASDTAAALTLGYNAVGRISNTGTHDTVCAYISRYKPDNTVIIPDNDPDSNPIARDLTNMGATKLCEALNERRHKAVVMKPRFAKDLRAWLNNGGTREQLDKAIEKTIKAHT